MSYLEGLNEGPQQDSDSVALPQQLDETSCSEEPQEAQVDHLILGGRQPVRHPGMYNIDKNKFVWGKYYCEKGKCLYWWNPLRKSLIGYLF